MFKKIDNVELIQIIANFRSNKHAKYSNIFNINEDFTYEIICREDILLIRQQCDDFYRLYFISTDINSISHELSHLEGKDYIFNIPLKGEFGEWEALLQNDSIKLYSIYKRYYNKNIEKGFNLLKGLTNDKEFLSKNGYVLSIKANKNDAYEVHNLLIKTFNKYTDYIPDILQIEKMIEKESVLINRSPNNQICGILIFERTGIKCYENFWVDNEGLGLYLMYELYRYMYNEGIKYTNFWIADWNKSVIKIHKLLGAMPDGTIDYTFKI